VSVNLSNFNVVVQDTDFVYRGRGPGIALTRTYNADDPRESTFGRSWTFNYDVFLAVNPNGSIDIKRDSGKVDHFTPRGDGTYQPPLWVYDELHRHPDGTFRLKLKRTKLTQYFNAQGKLTRLTDRQGHAVTLQYAGDWQLHSVTDAVGRVTRFHYTPQGKISAVVDPLGRQATFTYDNNHHLVTTVDMAGTRVEYTYDKASYMTAIATPQGQMALQYGATPHFRDFPAVIKALRDPLGNTTIFDTDPSIAWVIDAQGHQTFYFNNDNGETTEITDPLGHKTHLAYTHGNLTRVTDANGHVTTLEYDGRGNVTRGTDPLGNTLQFQYDSRDNLTQVVDAAGNAYRYDYDTHDHLTKVTSPKNGTITFTYDGAGQLTALIDAQQHTTAFVYDSAGNATSETTPVGAVTTATYDGVGRLSSLTDPKGNLFRYSDDGIDRLTEILHPDGSATRYTYGCCGLTSITDASGTLHLAYDEANRLVRFTNTENQTIQYDYDRDGNLLALTYPGGKVVRYEYDAAGQLKKVSDWLGHTTVYNYDPAGNLLSSVNANGTLTGYQYNTANRLVTLINATPNGSLISGHKYTLDYRSNQTNVAAFEPLSPVLAPPGVSYTYGADNRIQTANAATFTYDANGNLTAVSGAKSGTYIYDALNRLTQVTFSGYDAQYQYDSLGSRIARMVNGTKTTYLVDPNGPLSQVLAETDGAGNITAYYVYGLGLISKVTPEGQAYFYHYDGLGSTVAMTDASGSVVNKYAYDAFGNVLHSAETVPNPFKYVGGAGIMDEGNGLLYMRARYYDPELGRFINQDPIGLRGGMNLYAYVGNNPLNFVDPSGLDWLKDAQRWWDHVREVTKSPPLVKKTQKFLKEAGARTHAQIVGIVYHASQFYADPGKYLRIFNPNLKPYQDYIGINHLFDTARIALDRINCQSKAGQQGNNP
jgi:RHS repeat-associated protein